MSVKDRLQIILITYNRDSHVEKALKQILTETSPVKDYDILVLDNNSTDNTQSIVESWQKDFPNLKYQKNRHNIGLAGNIAKAMEIAEKDYLWIICDDDKYDFSNWSEVEEAINNDEKLICVSRFVFGNRKDIPMEYLIAQMVFLPATIFKTSLFTDTAMRNIMDNIFTYMPHVCPIIGVINSGEKIYVCKEAIVIRQQEVTTDVSYTRGNLPNELFPKIRYMSWLLGYANVLEGLNDKKLIEKCLHLCGPGNRGGELNFLIFVCEYYKDYFNYFCDICLKLKFSYKIKFFAYYFMHKYFHFDITKFMNTYKRFRLSFNLLKNSL